jgi:hypothetical protein
MSKVKDTPENYETCMKGNCSACPSYPKGSGEGLYCTRGPGKSVVDRRGCSCPECPVWTENGLSGMYYCAKL